MIRTIQIPTCLSLLAIALLVGSPLFATESVAPTLALTLRDALRLGIDRSQEIEIAESQFVRAQAEIDSARSAAFPQLRAEASYERTLLSPFELPSDFAGSIPFGNENAYNAGLRVDQVLYAGGQVAAGKAIARDFAAAAEADTSEAVYDLGLAVVVAYYQAVLAERLEEITHEQAAQAERQLEKERLRFKAGNAARLDVLRLEVERSNLEPEIVAAQNARASALLDLKRLLNIEPEAPIELVDRLAPEGFVALGEAKIVEIANGFEARPSLLSASLLERIREEQITVTRGEYRPRADLVGRFGVQALPVDIFPAGDDFNEDFTVALAFRVPLFSGGRRKADIAVATEAHRQERLRYEQLGEAVALEVARTAAEVRRAIALVGARASVVAQAEEVLRLTGLAYDKGVTTYLELADARFGLRQARANEATALHDYYVAVARFLRASGAPIAAETLRLVQTPPAVAADDRSQPTFNRASNSVLR